MTPTTRMSPPPQLEAAAVVSPIEVVILAAAAQDEAVRGHRRGRLGGRDLRSRDPRELLREMRDESHEGVDQQS